MDTDVSWFQTKTFPLSRMHDVDPSVDFRASSSNYVPHLYESLDDAPHEFPFVRRPFPTNSAVARRVLTDPSLCLTPEKRMPTLVRLRKTSGEDGRIGTNDPLRESRVHFDQHVSVHHLSPPADANSSSDTSSRASPLPDSFQNDDYSSKYSNDFSTNRLSSQYGPTASATNYYNGSFIDNYGEAGDDLNVSSYGFPCSRDTNPTRRIGTDTGTHSPADQRVKSISGDVAALDTSNMSDSNEPISVVASDLRRFTINASAPSNAKKIHQNASSVFKSKTAPVVSDRAVIAPPMNVYRSLPVVVERTGAGELSPTYRPLKDFGSLLSESGDAQNEDPAVGDENPLARPELNSTLRVGRDINKMKGTGFDFAESMRLRVNARTKMMIDEKAHYKLNQRAPQFSDLLSLEVQKDELLNRITEEKLARVRPGFDSTERAHRLEELVTRAPDIMDFFTPDLQKESISQTLNGTVSLQTPLQTVQLERAFDVYRHTRQWQQW